MTLESKLRYYGLNYLLTFDSRREAVAYVKQLDSVVYHLWHNEYQRPDYTVVKVPHSDVYVIRVKRYWYGPYETIDYLEDM